MLKGGGGEGEGERQSDYGEESGKCSQFKRLNQLHCTNNSVRKLRKSEVKPPPTPFHSSSPLCMPPPSLASAKNFEELVVLQRS